MRCDSYYGLSKRGRKIIHRTTPGVLEGTVTYPGGRQVAFRQEGIPSVVKIEVIGTIAGMYKDEVWELHRYTLRNGQVLEEFVQENILCGGPNYFIALRYKNGRVLKSSLWSKKEIGLD